MPQLCALPDSRIIEIEPNETMLAAILRQGIPHVHVCGGRAECSTCRVHIISGLKYCSPRGDCEKALAIRLNLPFDVRLVCQTRVTGNVCYSRPVFDALDVKLTQQALNQPSQHLGTQQQVAVLFSDIRGYTSFANRLPPFDLFHVLNRYFEAMSEVVAAYHGHISDFIGDGLMVVFGLSHPATAVDDAVAAGHAMLRAVERLNPYLKQMYDCTFHVRLGLHYGKAVVGHIGAGNDRKLATIGDTVNVASRLEDLNKQYGTTFLVSEAVVLAASPALVLRQGFLTPLKGKKGLHRVFEVQSKL
ncbi:adenylate/guanylate cyclase domain-containing protein [Hymenobacter negativus]|uniref:Adenylate/guanylate cyclase domain-containing protein n=1 Tax=Hymenobacter negativus TaxID=2795026 RepID=A0ABS3QLJ0_9BACT|nr:adenylate/guanylate cyclase domain-containing protein [Hymenobacter negativus]MBO2012117.1 adenylate/guanylate cyclase domain-containing protein [Hymenobacter negativus]